MPKITPHLWFDTQAEEAVNFYVSIFLIQKFVTSLVTANRARKLLDDRAEA